MFEISDVVLKNILFFKLECCKLFLVKINKYYAFNVETCSTANCFGENAPFFIIKTPKIFLIVLIVRTFCFSPTNIF